MRPRYKTLYHEERLARERAQDRAVAARARVNALEGLLAPRGAIVLATAEGYDDIRLTPLDYECAVIYIRNNGRLTATFDEPQSGFLQYAWRGRKLVRLNG